MRHKKASIPTWRGNWEDKEGKFPGMFSISLQTQRLIGPKGALKTTVPALYFIQEETATQRVALLPNSTRSQSSLV